VQHADLRCHRLYRQQPLCTRRNERVEHPGQSRERVHASQVSVADQLGGHARPSAKRGDDPSTSRAYQRRCSSSSTTHQFTSGFYVVSVSDVFRWRVYIKFGVNTFALKLPIRRQDFGFEAARTRLSTNANDTCTTMTHGGAVLDEKF